MTLYQTTRHEARHRRPSTPGLTARCTAWLRATFRKAAR